MHLAWGGPEVLTTVSEVTPYQLPAEAGSVALPGADPVFGSGRWRDPCRYDPSPSTFVARHCRPGRWASRASGRFTPLTCCPLLVSGRPENDSRGSPDHGGADCRGQLPRCGVCPHQGSVRLWDDVGTRPLEHVHLLDHDVAVVEKPQRCAFAWMNGHARAGRRARYGHDGDDVEPVDGLDAVDIARARLRGVLLALRVFAGPEIAVIDDGAGFRRSRSRVLPACGIGGGALRRRGVRLRSCPGRQGGTPAARW